jgi:hypothetical protein
MPLAATARMIFLSMAWVLLHAGGAGRLDDGRNPGRRDRFRATSTSPRARAGAAHG